MTDSNHVGNARTVALALAVVYAATPAGAQSIDFSLDTPESGDSGWTVGLGVGFAPDYEGSDDYDVVPIPKLRWERGDGIYVDLTGLKASANLLARSDLQIGPVINFRRERDDVDEDAVDALEDVDSSLEVGAFADFVFGSWTVGVEGLIDVADGHDGWLVEFRGGYDGTIGSDWAYGAGVSTTYASDDYMESYFGIDAAGAAASGLNTFDADAGLKDFGLDFAMTYLNWQPWSVTGLVAYKRLLDDAEDSPVTDDVGSPDQAFAGVIVSYRF